MENDIIIIGAGPVGMYSAFYAGLRGLKTTLVDSLPYLGGQLETLYKEKYIYDLPGYDKITAGDFIKNLKKQLDTVSEYVTIQLANTTQTLTKVEDGFVLDTTNGQIKGKSILIAAGNGVFKPRLIGVDNESGTNLHYSISELSAFKGHEVVILGGGDSAVDWALMLESIADKVTIVHRRNEFRAKELSVENLKKSSVQICTPYVVESINKNNDQIESIVIKNVEDESLQTLSADDFLVNYGFITSFGSIKNWNLEMSGTAIKVNTLAQTSIPGIFAVGNAAEYPGKLKLITPGLGEVPIAIDAIKHYIDPNYKTGNIFSSTMKK